MPAQARQASPCLQGLLVRPGRAPRGRGRCPARRGRQDARRLQARRRRPDRGGLYRPGQGRLVRQLRARRRVPLRRMPVHWPAAVQAWRGSASAQQRRAVVEGDDDLLTSILPAFSLLLTGGFSCTYATALGLFCCWDMNGFVDVSDENRIWDRHKMGFFLHTL